jgi:hypothetical protein
MRRLLAIALTAGALAALPAATPAKPVETPAATIAKSCSRGYTHAIIGGAHKCLRRGQYCSRPRDREYHRYGFHCHRRDRNGDYHLE